METTATPGFSLLWADESDSPPPEQADWPMNIPWELNWILPPWGPYRWLSHIFQWQVSVHCEYQTWTIALISLTQAPLQLAQPKPLDQPDSEELWANAMLFT